MFQILDKVKTFRVNPRNQHDALVLAVHALMLCQGFRCIGTTESSPIREQELPQDWNRSDDVYSFKYKHQNSDLTFLLKMLVLGKNLILNAKATEQSDVYTVTLDVDQFVKGNRFDNPDEYYTNLNQLSSLVTSHISEKWVPSIHQAPQEQPSQQSFQQPYAAPFHRTPPVPPRGGVPIHGVGHDDLYPDIQSGIPPTRRWIPPGGDRGASREYWLEHGRDLPFGRGHIPRGVPPGARFDQYAPPGAGGRPDPDHLRRPPGEPNPYYHRFY